MNYQQTIDFLFTQFPAYQLNGTSAYKPGLERILKLSKIAGNPHNAFKSIHLAGTNGKGSCSHMLASILQEAGFKVGLFTSPHLVDFRERIKINGIEIPQQKVVDFVKKFKTKAEVINPSFFEYTTIMAFQFFAEENVDIAIIETGLGGRLDCSNIIKPEISVITNIGLDHQQFLGDTIPEIALEKAGIIKPKTTTVIGRKQEDTTKLFKKISQQLHSKLIWAENCNCPFELDLKGDYQKENAQTVLATIKELQVLRWKISEQNIKNGFSNTIRNTCFKGRWQTLNESPKVICDTGHNSDGIKAIVKQLHRQSFQKLHIVWGMANDKDVSTLLNLLPKIGFFYWCAAKSERSIDVQTLLEVGAENECMGKAYSSVQRAVEAALKYAKSDDLVFIGGSTFVVAEAIPYFMNLTAVSQ